MLQRNRLGSLRYPCSAQPTHIKYKFPSDYQRGRNFPGMAPEHICGLWLRANTLKLRAKKRLFIHSTIQHFLNTSSGPSTKQGMGVVAVNQPPLANLEHKAVAESGS
jgi:hypothetical protein